MTRNRSESHSESSASVSASASVSSESDAVPEFGALHRTAMALEGKLHRLHQRFDRRPRPGGLMCFVR